MRCLNFPFLNFALAHLLLSVYDAATAVVMVYGDIWRALENSKCPLHWKHGTLTTGLLESPPRFYF